jgi:hypothetical protein
MHYSLWLVPRSIALIEDLADVFDAIHFLPHVTVLEGFERTDQTILQLDEPIELTFDHLEYTKDTIIMRARKSPTFDALAKRAHTILGGTILEPHLSLAYFPRDYEGARGFAFGMIDFPVTIRFDTLEAWDTRGDLTPEHIGSWSMIHRAPNHL